MVAVTVPEKGVYNHGLIEPACAFLCDCRLAISADEPVAQGGRYQLRPQGRWDVQRQMTFDAAFIRYLNEWQIPSVDVTLMGLSRLMHDRTGRFIAGRA